MHDLSPLPYTQTMLRHVSDHIPRVQDFLGQRLGIENPSSYVAFAVHEMSEWVFMGELWHLADCELLLEMSNVCVSSVNHHFDPQRYVDALPPTWVHQIHLAGHETQVGDLIDSHDQPICEAAWQLCGDALQRCGPVPLMIERDDHIPDLHELLDELELDLARKIHAQTLKAQECPA